jgi:hypothetical protein
MRLLGRIALSIHAAAKLVEANLVNTLTAFI